MPISQISTRELAMQDKPIEKPKGPTCAVPEAGKYYFGLGRNGSYEAARRGEIPTIKLGGRLRAVVAALDKKVAGE